MGGGGVSIPQRNLGNELSQLNQGFWNRVFPSFQNFTAQNPLLTAGQSQIQNTLTSGGALPQDISNQITQDTGAQLSAAGMRNTNPGIFSIELNKERYREGRFNTALQQAIGLENAQTGNFMNLFGPTLGFGQDVFSSNQNAQAAANIANANKSSGLLGGLVGGGASGLSSIGSYAALTGLLASDKRLKKNIKDTGEETEEGIPIKTFEYRHRAKGVMADDVEQIRPDAVVMHPSGFKMVDYGKLKIPMQLMAEGGSVKGKKKKTKKNTDSVHVMATPGEFMLNRGAVALMGMPRLEYINEMGKRHPTMMQEGGSIPEPQGGPNRIGRMPPGQIPPSMFERPTIMPRARPLTHPAMLQSGGPIVDIITEKSDLQGREREGGPITPEEMDMLYRARQKAAKKMRARAMNEPLDMAEGGEIRSNRKGQEKPGVFGMQHGGRIRAENAMNAPYNFNFGIGGIDIPPADMSDPYQNFGAEPGYGGAGGFGNAWWNSPFVPPVGSAGFLQGGTAIPTSFDQWGYPYAVPVQSAPSFDQSWSYGLGMGFGPLKL